MGPRYSLTQLMVVETLQIIYRGMIIEAELTKTIYGYNSLQAVDAFTRARRLISRASS